MSLILVTNFAFSIVVLNFNASAMLRPSEFTAETIL